MNDQIGKYQIIVKILFIVSLSIAAVGCVRQPQQSIESTFDVEETTISAIHRAIQEKTCTCEQLVSTYLQRIKTYDQPTGLNAIILTNPEALQRARELDAEYRKTGRLRKLHCIPVIVKDNYNTKGLQTTAGSLALKGFAPADGCLSGTGTQRGRGHCAGQIQHGRVGLQPAGDHQFHRGRNA